MTIPSISEKPLEREWRLFNEELERLFNALLNRLFDLSPRAATQRLTWLTILFFISGFLLSLINYPLNLWLTRLQDIFLYVFNPTYRQAYTTGDPISSFVLFGLQVFVDPRSLRYIPLLLAPYFISLQSAAIYLADIFNLPEVSIARKHIIETALSGNDEAIRISKGEVLEEHRKSPNFLIGGPGKIIVDIDSAALFEKPDGTPHIIGPTGGEPGGKATIEGFERFREAIDLRNHFIDLRDQDEKSSSVKSRSSDGIEISATDVRFLFSVDRGENNDPSPETPYPFSKSALEKIVYKATSSVVLDQNTPSKYEFRWVNNMVSLIRGKLGGFMGQRPLTEYLASIGLPEVDRARQQADSFARYARSVTPPGETPPEPGSIPDIPNFVPRPQISSLFSQFTEDFAKTARDRGVHLEWIGVGTWKTPLDEVAKKHIEAWNLNRENSENGKSDSFEGYENEHSLEKLVGLIQSIPIGSYYQAMKTTKKPYTVIRAILTDYRKHLLQAQEIYKSRGKSAPDQLTDALKHLDEVLYHWMKGSHTTEDGNEPVDGEATDVGGKGVFSDEVFTAFDELIQLVAGDEAEAIRLIKREQSLFPNEPLEKLIRRAIERLLRGRI
jgi:hypothetical protein